MAKAPKADQKGNEPMTPPTPYVNTAPKSLPIGKPYVGDNSPDAPFVGIPTREPVKNYGIPGTAGGAGDWEASPGKATPTSADVPVSDPALTNK